jgi:hypothetical protein
MLRYLLAFSFLLFAPHVSAEDIPAPLDQVIEGEISVPAEVDRYMFDGTAGQKVTVSAYYDSGGSTLGSSASLKLIGSNGTVLVSPPMEYTERRVCGGYCYIVKYYFVRIDNFELPENGTYTVEISHSSSNGTGRYWLGISDPNPTIQSLDMTRSYTGSYAIRGALQEWQFDGIAGETVGWSYRSDRAIRGMRIGNWEILDSGSNVVHTAFGGEGASIIFTPDQTGTYSFRFTGAPLDIRDVDDIGPSDYVLDPFVIAPLNERIDRSLLHRWERDLYSFSGNAGDTITISAYLGNNRGLGIGDSSYVRLLSGTGGVIASPPQERSGNCGSGCKYFMRLDDFELPLDGTYVVEVWDETGLGAYWLGISDPSDDEIKDLPITEEVVSSFGVRRDKEAWTFYGNSGVELGWTYEGQAELWSWTIKDSAGNVVTGGPSGGTTSQISIVPQVSGMHVLTLDDRLFQPDSPEGIGPFPYRLIPYEGNESPIDPLLLQYAPILHIFRGDFKPKEVNSMLQESDLRSKVGEDIYNPTPSDLANTDPVLSVEDALDMRDSEAGSTPVVPPLDRFDKYQNAIYGRVTKDTPTAGEIKNLDRLTAGKEYTILQYWFFYPYNNFEWSIEEGEVYSGNNHEGDWEMIQLIVDPDTLTPEYATYSWHWAGSNYIWPPKRGGEENEIELQLTGDHPHVFVGIGGHANWANGGINRYKGFFSLMGDITPESNATNAVLLREQQLQIPCTSTCEPYSVLRIPTDDNSELDDWNSFSGMWGENKPGHQNGEHGPNSPGYISYGTTNPIVRWKNPIAWTNDPTPAGWGAQANSPINLSIFDSLGKRVGLLPDGSIQTDISGTYYFHHSNNEPEWAVILTDDMLSFQIDGTGEGPMDFYVSKFSPEEGEQINLKYEGVPITETFVGYVKPNSDSQDTIMEIDEDGDGDIDKLFNSGDFLTLQDAINALPDRAFKKGRIRYRRTLLRRTNMVDKWISKGRYRLALIYLNLLERKVQRSLVDIEPNPGESTKEDVLQMIESTITHLNND